MSKDLRGAGGQIQSVLLSFDYTVRVVCLNTCELGRDN